MPVDHCAGLIFIHIPKTAGTSIETAIGLHGDWRIENQDRLFGKIKSRRLLRKNLSSNFLQHLTIQEISMLLGDRIQDYKFFTVVRDPWTRFLSSFRRKDPDLCEFVRWRISKNLEEFSLNEYLRLLRWVKHPHLNSQSSFLGTTFGESHLFPNVNVFKFEELNRLEDWLSETLRRSISFPRIQLPLASLPVVQEKKLILLKQKVRSHYFQDCLNFDY